MCEFILIKNGIPYSEIKDMTDEKVHEILIIINEFNELQSEKLKEMR
jgi:hypothetical protein